MLYDLIIVYVQALVNIPALSERTLRRDIASSEITLDSRIQVRMFHIGISIRPFALCVEQLAVLDEAARSCPNSWWWLKADGCDLVKGLKESVKLQWSGDVDLNDGDLQKQYSEYKNRLQSVERAGLVQDNACADFKSILQDLTKDLEFIQSGKIYTYVELLSYSTQS